MRGPETSSPAHGTGWPAARSTRVRTSPITSSSLRPAAATSSRPVVTRVAHACGLAEESDLALRLQEARAPHRGPKVGDGACAERLLHLDGRPARVERDRRVGARAEVAKRGGERVHELRVPVDGLEMPEPVDEDGLVGKAHLVSAAAYAPGASRIVVPSRPTTASAGPYANAAPASIGGGTSKPVA